MTDPKDAYYFSHDSNARNDHRILAVRMKYGIMGYGIYFGIVEMLRESKGYELLNDWSTIAFDLREKEDVIQDIVKNFELFVVTKDRFFSESLKRRMNELDEKRAKRSIAGRVGGLASASNRKATVNDCSSSKVKQSKVNKISSTDFLETLKHNIAYKHIDIESELAKMDAWLSTKPHRKKTTRFVLNWLNRIEKPLEKSGGDSFGKRKLVL